MWTRKGPPYIEQIAWKAVARVLMTRENLESQTFREENKSHFKFQQTNGQLCSRVVLMTLGILENHRRKKASHFNEQNMIAIMIAIICERKTFQ